MQFWLKFDFLSNSGKKVSVKNCPKIILVHYWYTKYNQFSKMELSLQLRVPKTRKFVFEPPYGLSDREKAFSSPR